jgi:glycosyltransferase involved in cell wall biosynthesis
LRLAVDARTALVPEPRGEGRSLRRLYAEIRSLRPDWTVHFFGDGRGVAAGVERFGATGATLMDPPGYRLNTWENVALPLAVSLKGASLLHCTSSSAPWWCPVPVVVTVHDVIPICFDEGLPPAHKRRFERQLRHALRNARGVIAVSEHTKSDLTRLFELSPDRVTVVPWGADPVRSSRVESDGRPYLLAFGGDSPRKNTHFTVRAFLAVAARVPDVDLVIVGLAKGRLFDELVTELRDSDMNGRVRFPGYVDDDALEALVSGAIALVYLSLYEGFGLPLLEAMSRGVPVIASDRTSVPEVTGDAAALVDPTDLDAASRAIERAATSAEWRRAYADAAFERARRFSWRDTAQRTVAVLERASA